MDRLYDSLNTSGNLEIWKVYEDGKKELFFADHNMIVSGLGASLMSLFGGIHSNDITDYQIRYFQVGTSSHASVTTSITNLHTPITQVQYDPSATANIVVSSVFIRLSDSAKVEQDAVQIPWQHMKRITPTSVLYTLVLDTQAANDLTLNEVGLFVRSPFRQGTVPTPVLAAYKKFPFLDKKREFSLIFKWTLYF